MGRQNERGRASGRARKELRGIAAIPLWIAILVACIAAAVVVICTYKALGQILGVAAQPPLSAAQRLTAAFAAVTALGATVALVVNVRRQDVAEQGVVREVEATYTERFRTAVTLMAGASPVEKISGLHTLAAVGDEHPRLRQQVLDVLCGYLRLSRVEALAAGDESQDKAVRELVQKVLIDRVARDDVPSWSKCDFDFSGVVFYDADFTGAQFSGRFALFDDAVFVGDGCVFSEATFESRVSFRGTDFNSSHISFVHANWEGSVDFAGAEFEGRSTLFNGARFRGGASFVGAVFASRNETSFDNVEFPSEQSTSFQHAIFTSSTTTFLGVVTGTTASSNGDISFNSASFDPEIGGSVQLDFSRDTLDFGHVTLDMGRVTIGCDVAVSKESRLISVATINMRPPGRLIIDGETVDVSTLPDE